jgi:methylmalonyl-CoA mutase
VPPATSESDILPLAADFPAASDEAWLKLVDKALAGAPFDKKLVSRTYDGIAIKPLYTRADSGPADPAGLPGGAPYVRGASPLVTSQGGWDIRPAHDHPDPAVANAQILDDLEGGATSIVLKTDPSGANGVAIRSRADVETVLKDVLLDIAPIVMEPSGPSLPLSAVFLHVLAKRGLQPEHFRGNLGGDPLSSLATVGKLIVGMPSVLARAADTAAYVARRCPLARALNVKSIVYHSAGAGEAMELGAVMATAIEYLRCMTAAGMSIDDACGQIAFTLAADTDVFMTVAKFRAARKLWARIVEACGGGARVRTAPIYAQSAPRMLSRRDPATNILRATAACFAAGVGGAEAITIAPFDAALGYSRALPRRIARNLQIVLMEESGINRVVDAAGGAFLFESLTDKLAAAAWASLQEIERAGGMAGALTSGMIAERIGAVANERLKNISRRKDAVTGVSEFPDIHETAVEADRTDVAAVLARRDQAPVGDVGPLPKPGSGAMMEALIAAAARGVNILAMAKALQDSAPTAIPPLRRLRLAEPFEALRDRGDAARARPKVYLATIGSAAEFTPRATFAKNFFEAGGIEAVAGASFGASGARIAVLCSSDTLYKEKAAETARALKAAGARAVYLAGRGGELEIALKTAGVDDFIYVGCDAAAVLAAAHDRLGASS